MEMDHRGIKKYYDRFLRIQIVKIRRNTSVMLIEKLISQNHGVDMIQFWHKHQI